jgi:crotonobetainyl-CoA:carnitine CoA-transferase CaiB-like acyl-CoA transferase
MTSMFERRAEISDRRLPLEGVRVLAQAIVWAGPFATLLLSDLGAEVIEIESIQHLNPTRTNYRHLPPSVLAGRVGVNYVNRDPSEGFWNRQSFFNYAKRGCKSVTLNLHSERGRELFYELVRHSDVFMENNAANVAEHLHIDYPTLSGINPRLIMVRFPGFGTLGPYRHFKGYGTIMEGVAGHTLLRGYEDSDPSMTPNSLHGDPNAGANAAIAVQMALYARERTGNGQEVDLSQSEAVLGHLAYAFMDYSANRRLQGHWGNRHPSMAPYGVYRCAGDDRWIALAVPSDAVFAGLCDAMGRPDLIKDKRYATVVARYEHRADLDAAISEWSVGLDAHDLMLHLQGIGVPATELMHQEEMTEDAHLQAREFFQSITHPAAGTHLYPGPMGKFGHTPLAPARSPAPMLGQHNEEVLRGILGLSESEYAQLIEEEVIGTAYLESARAS